MGEEKREKEKQKEFAEACLIQSHRKKVRPWQSGIVTLKRTS
jgi:hypothetical protein